jgi:hypothetical protein
MQIGAPLLPLTRALLSPHGSARALDCGRTDISVCDRRPRFSFNEKQSRERSNLLVLVSYTHALIVIMFHYDCRSVRHSLVLVGNLSRRSARLIAICLRLIFVQTRARPPSVCTRRRTVHEYNLETFESPSIRAHTPTRRDTTSARYDGVRRPACTAHTNRRCTLARRDHRVDQYR